MFSSLPEVCGNDAAVLDEFEANGVSVYNFEEHYFAERLFTLILIYRKQSMRRQQFF